MTEYEKLKNKYGFIEAKTGKNEKGEDIIVSIDEECASIRTLQKDNHWQRINIYYPDGTAEELYER